MSDVNARIQGLIDASPVFLFMKGTPTRTRATRWGALTVRQRAWAASISLKAIAMSAALEPGPLAEDIKEFEGSGFLEGGKVTGRYQGLVWDAIMPAKPTIARPWRHGDPYTGPLSDDHRGAESRSRSGRPERGSRSCTA